MSVQEKMTALANEIRELSGMTELLGLDAMAEQTAQANTQTALQMNLIVRIRDALKNVSGGTGDMFTSGASGHLPTVYRGYAVSTFEIRLESGAAGTINQEV